MPVAMLIGLFAFMMLFGPFWTWYTMAGYPNPTEYMLGYVVASTLIIIVSVILVCVCCGTTDDEDNATMGKFPSRYAKMTPPQSAFQIAAADDKDRVTSLPLNPKQIMPG